MSRLSPLTTFETILIDLFDETQTTVLGNSRHRVHRISLAWQQAKRDRRVVVSFGSRGFADCFQKVVLNRFLLSSFRLSCCLIDPALSVLYRFSLPEAVKAITSGRLSNGAGGGSRARFAYHSSTTSHSLMSSSAKSGQVDRNESKIAFSFLITLERPRSLFTISIF